MYVSALVLAGGASRRMGQDKLQLRRQQDGPESVLEHVVCEVTKVAHDVRLVVPPEEDVTRFADIQNRASVTLHKDDAWYAGPVVALANAWVGLEGADAVCVVAGDLPGLSFQVLQTCLARLTVIQGADGAVVVRDGQLQPLLGVYRPSAGNVFKNAARDGVHRMMRAIETLCLEQINCDMQGWPKWWTHPVHTPADYALWLEEGVVESK